MIGIARDAGISFEMTDEGTWRPTKKDEVSLQLASELNRHTAQIIAREYGPSKGFRHHFAFLRTVEVLGLEKVAFTPPESPSDEIVY